MLTALRTQPRRLAIYASIGVSAGLAYALLDHVLDGYETHHGWPGILHEFIDSVFPVLVGAVAGIAWHTLRVQRDLEAQSAQRAQDLRSHLLRVERDQAAWVVAAATLHEVRNPLHVIGLLLDEILAGGGALDAKTTESLVGRARSQMERITAHLQQLRSLSEAGPPTLRAIPLVELARTLAREQGSIAHDAHVEVRVDADGEQLALAEPVYVRLILETLLGNALDAVRPRGRGAVTIGIRRGESGPEVTVADDGPGVAPEMQDALFRPLHTTKEAGLGLGLSIARALAQSMGGDLELDRRPQAASGGRFTLSLRGTS